MRELEAAREAALRGGEIALARFRGDPAARRKRDGTWVTEADEEVEAAIRDVLAGRFPGHNVHGEEEGLRAAGGGPPAEGAPTWIVDPIDGTHNYMLGIPIWAVLVALRVDGEGVVGVVHAPALGETYEAARGGGSRMNGEPIAVAPVERLEDAHLIYSGLGWFVEEGLGEAPARLAARTWRDRGFGDFWGHVLVARGAAHVMVEAARLSVWDVAALEPIVAEAGGRLTGLDGSPWSPGRGAVTTNGLLHAEVVAVLRQ